MGVECVVAFEYPEGCINNAYVTYVKRCINMDVLILGFPGLNTPNESDPVIGA